MNDLEKQLDECNVRLYQILNKIADIRLDMKEKQLEEINDEILKNEILSGEIKI